MSEIKRYYAELAEENDYGGFVLASDFDRVTAERDALQQRLTAADERVVVLEGLLREVKGVLAEFAGSSSIARRAFRDIDAALKPSPQTNTSGKAHCPHDGICHTGNETCAEAVARVAQFNDDHDSPPERDD